jgi:hypothetical protein
MATKSDDTLQISLLGFIRILAISSNRRCTWFFSCEIWHHVFL